jgi:hypothetical protein
MTMTIWTPRAIRRAAAAVAVAAAGLLAGCDDDTGPVDSAIFSIRLTVDGVPVTIDRGGDVTGGPLTVTADSDASVSAAFLDEEGDPVATTGLVELRIEGDAAVVFIRSGATTGTLRADEGGPYEIEVQAWDDATDRALFAETVQLLVSSPLD